MEGLTDLFKRIDYTRDCILRNKEDEYTEKFQELVEYILELTLHVKQLQLEVVKLAAR